MNGGAIAKASLNRALVAFSRPETKRATLGQDEALVTQSGGPNVSTLKS